MAAQSKLPIVFMLALLAIAAPSAAQVMPGWSGGGAIRRTDTASTPAARTLQFRDRLAWTWSAPRWIPGRAPVGGSFAARNLRPALPWLRTWVP